MAKLTDGLVFVFKPNRGNIVIEEVDLVMCRNCEEYITWEDGTRICGRLGSYYGDTAPDDYCSYGRRREDGKTD